MAGNLKVLLREDVDNLGSGGEVVRVRAGFARNFLFSRGLAVPATEGNLKRVDELKRRAASRASEELAKAQDMATRVSGVSVKFERAVGEEGKMYGSVTGKDIEEAYTKAGVAIDRRRIQLAHPIRELGSFEVPLKLKGTLTATLKIEVVKKG